jgi:hypothetical protein
MSRISFATNYENEQVEVIAGWDNPLQTFFLDILVDDENEDIIYSSMYQGDGGFFSLEDAKKALAVREIKVPTGFWEKIGKKSREEIYNFGTLFSN